MEETYATGERKEKARMVRRQELLMQRTKPTVSMTRFASTLFMRIGIGNVVCIRSLFKREVSCPVIAWS